MRRRAHRHCRPFVVVEGACEGIQPQPQLGQRAASPGHEPRAASPALASCNRQPLLHQPPLQLGQEAVSPMPEPWAASTDSAPCNQQPLLQLRREGAQSLRGRVGSELLRHLSQQCRRRHVIQTNVDLATWLTRKDPFRGIPMRKSNAGLHIAQTISAYHLT